MTITVRRTMSAWESMLVQAFISWLLVTAEAVATARWSYYGMAAMMLIIAILTYRATEAFPMKSARLSMLFVVMAVLSVVAMFGLGNGFRELWLTAPTSLTIGAGVAWAESERSPEPSHDDNE